MGSATAMICTSANWNSAPMFARPWPPQPIRATLTFSLGATNWGPPSTWRGTTVNAATAEAVAPRNWRRLKPQGRGVWFFILRVGVK